MAPADAPPPGSPEWFALAVEDVVDTDRAIVDPHHHLWPPDGSLPYSLDDLHADTGDGHHIEATVFIECRASYRSDGPEHLRSVGETEFVAENAAESRRRTGQSPIVGIVANADLRLGDQLDEVLDAHAEAGGELFKGIRHAGASDPEPEKLRIAGRAPAGLYDDPDFRAGVARLGERGLTYDTWHYHHQNSDFARLATAVPTTTMVLDHFGTPLGVGRFEGKREEIFAAWKDDIAAIAEQPNVVAKLGGLAMPDNGFGWHDRDRPPSSDELVEAQARYYQHTIECFGPARCMFESNFPVDRFSISYRNFWNAAKKIAAEYSEADQDAMFRGTAKRIYRLP
ncbi:MAG: amidohydrolase family protein [Acidimicrobiales bacterium]